jgi:ketosteroid isomerase-like protein
MELTQPSSKAMKLNCYCDFEPKNFQGAPMMTPNLELAIEQSHAALGAILKGDPTLYQALYSEADDITLGNPFGPFAGGQQQVKATLARAAAHYRDGEVIEVESIANYVSNDLAVIVEVERSRAKVGGGTEIVSIAVRVTSVFRLEQSNWKLVHRHADPIATPRPATSVIST